MPWKSALVLMYKKFKDGTNRCSKWQQRYFNVTRNSDPFIGLTLSFADILVRISEFRNGVFVEGGVPVVLNVRETCFSTVSEI